MKVGIEAPDSGSGATAADAEGRARRQRQDGQDRRRGGRFRAATPAVPQADYADEQVPGARRAEPCKPGDLVRIEETRPLSKRKRWIVREIVERGVQV